jgi:predicted secreted protein
MKLQHFSQEVEVAVDGSLTIALYSCPSEGRQWSEAEISDQTVLQQIDHKLVMPEKLATLPPGTPGQEVWTFEALKKGTSTMFMEYTHPWEGGEKEPMLTFALTVTVK